MVLECEIGCLEQEFHEEFNDAGFEIPFSDQGHNKEKYYVVIRMRLFHSHHIHLKTLVGECKSTKQVSRGA